LSDSTSSISSSSSKHSVLTIASNDVKNKLKGLFHRHNPRADTCASPIIVSKHFPKIPILFLAVRKSKKKRIFKKKFFFRNVDKCEKLLLKIPIILVQMIMLV
jgi:hypothetical protein